MKTNSSRSKTHDQDKENRSRLNSQTKYTSSRERKVEELKEVIKMANAIETIRQKGQAKAKESKSDCRVM
jgi:hypothetical protein